MGSLLNLADNYERIKNIVSALRQNETELSGAMKDISDQLGFDDPSETGTKGRVIYSDFDLEDAERLVKEMSVQTGMSIEATAANLYSGLQYDEIEKTVNKMAVDPNTNLEKYLAHPQSAIGILTDKEDQVWNDSKYVLKGEFFALSLRTAADEKFGLMDTALAMDIVNISRLEIDEGEFERRQISDDTLNWLTAWENNYPLMQEYLSTGRVRDEVGELTIDVPGWSEKNIEDSMEALLQYDVDHPSRINAGRAYIPQYGDTFTDRRRKMIDAKFQEWGWNRGQTVKENVERIFKAGGYEPGNKAIFKDADMRHSLGYLSLIHISEPTRPY